MTCRTFFSQKTEMGGACTEETGINNNNNNKGP